MGNKHLDTRLLSLLSLESALSIVASVAIIQLCNSSKTHTYGAINHARTAYKEGKNRVVQEEYNPATLVTGAELLS